MRASVHLLKKTWIFFDSATNSIQTVCICLRFAPQATNLAERNQHCRKMTHSYHNKLDILFASHGAALRIGNFVSIGDKCTVFLGGNHYWKSLSTFPFGSTHRFGQRMKQVYAERTEPPFCSTNGDVTIGHSVWIGHGVTIMSGVRIGNGAIIAANAHVVKDVPDFAVVGGNPARVIRSCIAEEYLPALKQIRWWLWPDEKISANLHLLSSERFQEFIDAHLANVDRDYMALFDQFTAYFGTTRKTFDVTRVVIARFYNRETRTITIPPAATFRLVFGDVAHNQEKHLYIHFLNNGKVTDKVVLPEKRNETFVHKLDCSD